jgi:hypothetical protein
LVFLLIISHWKSQDDPDLTLRCTGNYAHPDDHAWSEQVVTQIQAWSQDSSSSALQRATTTFGYYRLAQTGTYSGSGAWCYPDQYQQEQQGFTPLCTVDHLN